MIGHFKGLISPLIAVLSIVLSPLSSIASAVQSIGFIYEIENGGRRTYLLGSIHGGVDPESLPAFVHEAFRKSTTVVFEGDPFAFESRYGLQVLTESQLHLNQSLSEQLPARAVDKLRQLLPEGGVDLALRSKPWAVSRLLSALTEEALKASGTNTDFGAGIDLAFLKKAKAGSQQNIVYLSEPEAFLTEVGSGYDLSDLVYELALPDPIGERTRCTIRMIEAFREGSETHLLENSKLCIGAKNLALFDRRSVAWQPKVFEIVREGGAFITVGAYHLFGAAGLIRFLEQHGFRVRRMSPDSAMN